MLENPLVDVDVTLVLNGSILGTFLIVGCIALPMMFWIWLKYRNKEPPA
ncbi:MAG: hypothetical protein HOF98_06835 [Gammaproteobacteria bacterium]|jgi:hypothetical protein|nr:hypothetical protein [Gammaproteobacteria bacterium]